MPYIHSSSSAPYTPPSNPPVLGANPAPSSAVPPRPKTIKLSCKALRTLPYRLTHPPPAQGIKPTWGVTPRFDVSLEDILDRKHLPPLGLKDFEEWLLFVEHSAENLYFILWLREYTQRYSTWAMQSKRKARANFFMSPVTPTQCFPGSTASSRERQRAYRTPPPSHPAPNPTLAMFYLRAKQTFLTPNAPYELDVPSDVLSQFHIGPMGASHNWEELQSWGGGYGINLDYGKPLHPPDPAVFAELAECVQDMLKASLERFVVATYNNVGTRRALCGSAGGIVIGLVGSVPPLACCFDFALPRWWRIAALPGMWLGMTIFISALYGVCMMIYVFGDLRQLRSFELARPPISSPRLLSSPAASLKGDHSALCPPNEKHSSINSAADAAAPAHPFALGFFARFAKFRSARRKEGDASAPGLPTSTGPRAGLSVISEKCPVSVELTRPPRALNGRSRPIPPKLTIITPGSVGQSHAADGGGGSDHEEGKSGDEGEPTRSRWSDEIQETPRPEAAAVKPSRRQSTTRKTDFPFSDSAAARSRTSVASSLTLSSDIDSDAGGSGGEDSDEEGSVEVRKPRIEVSEAYYDENPSPEGPATRTSSVPLWPDYIADAGEETATTAGFIRSYVYGNERWRQDLEMQISDRPVDDFDFDALPPRRPRFAHPSASSSVHPRSPQAHSQFSYPHSIDAATSPTGGKAPSIVAQPAQGPSKRSRFRLRVQFADQKEKKKENDTDSCASSVAGSQHGEMSLASPRSVIAHVQSRCSPENAAVVAAQLEKEREKAWQSQSRSGSLNGNASPKGSLASQASPMAFGAPGSPSVYTYRGASPSSMGPGRGGAMSWESATIKSPIGAATVVATSTKDENMSWRERFRRVSAVPAFGSPLTPVLNPVVSRAQWEIVVRSALIALLLSTIVIAGLVALPVPHISH